MNKAFFGPESLAGYTLQQVDENDRNLAMKSCFGRLLSFSILAGHPVNFKGDFANLQKDLRGIPDRKVWKVIKSEPHALTSPSVSGDNLNIEHRHCYLSMLQTRAWLGYIIWKGMDVGFQEHLDWHFSLSSKWCRRFVHPTFQRSVGSSPFYIRVFWEKIEKPFVPADLQRCEHNRFLKNDECSQSCQSRILAGRKGDPNEICYLASVWLSPGTPAVWLFIMSSRA